MNKLWLLRPIKGSKFWDPWYDKCFGFVVRAETEEDARELAQKDGCDETGQFRKDKPAWTDSNHSTCEQLTDDGDSGVIINDIAAA